MPTVLQQLDQAFRNAIQDAFSVAADPQLAVSQNEKFGDYQSNAAMGLAKTLAEKEGKKLNPRAIAEQIKGKLNLTGIASEISIAGPGFINVRLDPVWLSKQLQSISKGDRLGIDPVVKPETVVVDYSGPNIAKEMHVGHLRSTIIGDAISRILEFQMGDPKWIDRQNHIGDWGTQFGMLIAYIARRVPDGESTILATLYDLDNSGRPIAVDSINIADLEEFYRAAKKHFDDEEMFRTAAREYVVQLQSGHPPMAKSIWASIVNETRRHYQPIYRKLGVRLHPTDERGESFYNSMLADIVADLLKSRVAEKSEGAIVVKVPGYESPLIIQKSDGGYLYGTTDLAAIRYRVNELHANRIIYTHDSRQQQHFAQVFWTAYKAGWANNVKLEYAPFGTMLGEDGKPFKTRTGGTVKLKDLLDEAEERALKVVTEKNPELPKELCKRIAHSVGIGGVKYSDLSKDRISDYVFSFDKILALDGNTAPYLQYAHARICSIFRKAGDASVDTNADSEIRLESPYELALAKHILRLGEVIEIASRELKPHHLTAYLYELATRFSSFYENCPVLQSEPAIRQSRLALCKLAARTLERGLDLLGIEHPEQM